MRQFKRFAASLPTPASSSSPFLHKTTIAVALTGFFLSLLIIYVYGVNILGWDAWDLYPFFQAVQSGEGFWKHVWEPHNEHRIATTKLTFYLFSSLPTFDVRYIMIFGQLLHWATIFPILQASRLNGRRHLFIAILVGAFYLSPSHHNTQLWAFLIQWHCLWFGLVYSVFWLTQEKLTPLWFGGALLCGMLSYFSTSAGLIVLINGVFILGVRSIHHANQVKWLVIWIAITTVAIWIYFWDLPRSSNHSSLNYLLNHPDEFMTFFLSLLGLVIGANYVPTSALLGGMGLIYVIFLFFQKRLQEHFFLFGLIQFSVLVSAAVALGRVHFGLSQSLMSHYTILTLSLWLGLVILFQPKKRIENAFLVLIILLGIGTANKQWQLLKRSYAKRIKGATCYHQVIHYAGEVDPSNPIFRNCKSLYPGQENAVNHILNFQKLGIIFN